MFVKKTYPGKITKMNFQFEGDDTNIAFAIMNIPDRIQHIVMPHKGELV